MKQPTDPATGQPFDPPLTELELRFRYHCRADDRFARSVTRAYSEHCAAALAEWVAAHPQAEKKRAAPKKRAAKAPAKYNQKWDPNALTAANGHDRTKTKVDE